MREWILAAKPKTGWSHESKISRMLTFVGWAISILIATLVYFVVQGLQQQFKNKEQFALSLEKQVARRTEQLKKTKDLAEKANQAKSDFLAVMTHELRTPLNSIIGQTQLVEAMELGTTQREYLTKVSTSASLLLGLINNVLYFSKIESAKVNLTTRQFNLTKTIETITNVFIVSAEKKEIKFLTNISKDIPRHLIGDEEKLIQILTNLCGNAIKFTQTGIVELTVELCSVEELTEESVTSDRSKISLRFVINDTGIGIEQTQLNTLFEPFSQVNTGMAREFEGTGLGLSICKRIVESLGGSISVESELSVGSRFWFQLGFKVATGIPVNRDTDIESNQSLINRVKPVLSGIRIILAEDNEFNQFFVLALLKKVGVEAIVANNGKEVLAILEQQDVDGILMDLYMPEMDGIEATIAIRKLEKYKNIPIIALTANAAEENRKKALQLGMNGFLTKPIVFSLLYDSMIKWFVNHK